MENEQLQMLGPPVRSGHVTHATAQHATAQHATATCSMCPRPRPRPSKHSTMVGVTEDEASRLISSGKTAELMDRIYAKFAAKKVGGLVAWDGGLVGLVGVSSVFIEPLVWDSVFVADQQV